MIWVRLLTGFALYTLLFPDLVKDKENGTPFKDYMESDRYDNEKRLVIMGMENPSKC